MVILNGTIVSTTRMAGISWAERTPAGPLTASAAGQSLSSNPGRSQPGVSRRAS